MVQKTCRHCKKDFTVHFYRKDKAKYCSQSCTAKGRITEFGHPMLGKKGKPKSEEVRKQTSKRMLGNKFRENKEPWNKGKKFVAVSGDKHWNWQGGITTERTKQRTNLEYKEWRASVYKRDWYTCQFPGCDNKERRKERLEAHHIVPFRKDKTIIYDANNGITLCHSCHNLTRNKESMFEIFFKNILELRKETPWGFHPHWRFIDDIKMI